MSHPLGDSQAGRKLLPMPGYPPPATPDSGMLGRQMEDQQHQALMFNFQVYWPPR